MLCNIIYKVAGTVIVMFLLSACFHDESSGGDSTIGPVAPSDLVAIATSESSISLTWTDNSDNETGFIIERSLVSSSGFSQVGTVASNITSYDDNFLSASTTYYYRVIATNSAGDSAVSNAVNATTQATPASPPSAPANLQAQVSTSSTINLAWDDVNTETRYVVERSTSEFSGFTEIITLGQNTQAVGDGQLAPGTTYYYRIYADNSAGASGYSNTASATTLAIPPTVLGLARYTDENDNASADAGDTLVIPFNMGVSVNSVSANDFNLPVNGDSFGAGASVVAGPASNEVTIVLGTNPDLKSRHDFNPANIQSNAASGIDVSATLAVNAVESTATGADALATTPIDIIPIFKGTNRLYGIGDTHSIAVGDIDNDGDLDFIEGNGLDDGGAAQGNRIFTNQGNGLFQESIQPLGSAKTRSIALGDVNGDGTLDMVTGNLGSNNIWLNNGGGNFILTSQLGNNRTQVIALGDLDADGDLDLVIGNSGNELNLIRKNNGSGLFVGPPQEFGNVDNTDTYALALGDVDGDGDIDIVAGNMAQGANDNRLYLNDGNGIFTESSQSLGAEHTDSLVLGDIDADGDLDLITGNSGQANKVYINDGNGNFSDTSQSLGENYSTRSVLLIDLDADGDLDIAEGNIGQPNRMYMNDGNGIFTNSRQSMGEQNTYSLASGDLDGDGDIDLVEGNLSGQANRVWKNSLSGTWGSAIYNDSSQALGTYNTRSTALGDVDADGDIDIVTGIDGFGAGRVWLNDDSGNFTNSGQALGASSTYTIVLGDVDGDGDLDIVEGNYGQANHIRINNGTGTFIDSGQYLGGNYTYSITPGDVDNDGDIDLVEGNFGGNQGNRVWLNNGSGTYTDSGRNLGISDTQFVTLADVDGDGDLDLVAGIRDQGNRVWLNIGSGDYSDSGQSLGSNNTRSIVLGDIDRDGDLDMLTGNDGQANRVYTNDGSGTFSDSGQALGSNNSKSVSLIDIDGDGDLDLVVGNDGQANRLFVNNGSGTFSDSGQTMGNNNTQSIDLADLDGDGDLDLVCGNYGQANRVYIND